MARQTLTSPWSVAVVEPKLFKVRFKIKLPQSTISNGYSVGHRGARRPVHLYRNDRRRMARAMTTV
eukprot:7379931-Heterocapsa_arctica.AAC.1